MGVGVRGQLGADDLVASVHERQDRMVPRFDPEPTRKAPLGVFLQRGAVRVPGPDRTYPLSRDGSFAAEGITPGEWQVRLWIPGLLDGWGAGWHLGNVVVDAAKGSAVFESDLAESLFGRAEGSVTYDGKPWRNRECTFVLADPTNADAAVQRFQRQVTTDAEGRFVVERGDGVNDFSDRDSNGDGYNDGVWGH